MLSTEFFLAGDAIFTAVGLERSYTFRIKRQKDHPVYGATWKASVLSGPQNTSDYSYIGLVKENGSLILTTGSSFGNDAQPVKALRFVLKKAWAGEEMPAGTQLLPSSRCARCRRLLTESESILTGLGPICAGRSWNEKDEMELEPAC